MAQPVHHVFTFADYVLIEEDSPIRHDGTYPDASVVCGELELDPEDPKGHTIANPIVVVEVLSPSTEQYDRTEKREHYQTMPSLREIVLVAQDLRQVTIWRREDGNWKSHTTSESGLARLESVGCSLDLGEIYRDPLASTSATSSSS